MKGNYIFDYIDEPKFKKLEKSLKKYNMLAYKTLIFKFYVSLKNGEFLGKLVSTNQELGTKSYELKLPTDDMFVKVHGDVTLHYTVYEDQKTVMLDTITPEDILEEGHQMELETYKGVMISNKDAEKDMFKINLLNMLQK